jgi:hypothetical protein
MKKVIINNIFYSDAEAQVTLTINFE